jgi:polyketide biosynthesis enoyl-CoA hydratase PksH
MSAELVTVRFEERACFLELHDPARSNALTPSLIAQCHAALDQCDARVSVLVISGTPEVFCSGADLANVRHAFAAGDAEAADPQPLYELWLRLTRAPYVVVSHVRGSVNAGGIGFVAASDIVIAASTAQFSLSELLFGLFPACVLPFLIRRVGRQRAHYLTLMTQAFSAEQARELGLVDAHASDSSDLLRRHLLRLRRLSGAAVGRYKDYMSSLDDSLVRAQPLALSANRAMFRDPAAQRAIGRYLDEGRFPWEP